MRLWRASSQLVARQQIRRLTLHQYQSQELLKEAGAPVPRGIVARTAEEARAAVEELGNNSLLSAQLLKRKGSADLVARSPEHAAQLAATLLSSPDDSGIVPTELYISQPASRDQVWYLAMAIDRETCQPAIIISPHDGPQDDDTRPLPAQPPSRIRTYPFSLATADGVLPAALLARIASDLGLSASASPGATASLGRILTALHRIFRDKEALLLEVRSLARSGGDGGEGGFSCADSRFVFDDDARGRQPAVFALRDGAQEVRDEVEAERHGLVYVRMDGDVGTVVNGAGLAMATNDAIGLAGGRSANFLDAGGQATTQTMMQAFGIVLRDQRVRSILVNIYGGITRCDMIAESIIGAAKEMNIHVPMVVRLQGTNSEAGLKLLADANLGLHVESDFGKAAAKAVQLAKHRH